MDEAFACAQGLAADLRGPADGKLLAVYLHGSGALGGWVPGRSDVDVLIVVADDIADATMDTMAQAIATAGARCTGPGLEASIVAASAARDPGPPWPFLRHVVGTPAGPARVVAPDNTTPGDRDLLMHYVVCRTAGHPVLGPSPRELIGAIARRDVLAYLADELSWGLANAPERYAVLNACRALVYLADGTIISKVTGGQTALQRGLGPADVITRALAQQRGAQADQPPQPDATAFVLAAVTTLRSPSSLARGRAASARAGRR
jgi:streptomycin 3"-adenylyltransferase